MTEKGFLKTAFEIVKDPESTSRFFNTIGKGTVLFTIPIALFPSHASVAVFGIIIGTAFGKGIEGYENVAKARTKNAARFDPLSSNKPV